MRKLLRPVPCRSRFITGTLAVLLLIETSNTVLAAPPNAASLSPEFTAILDAHNKYRRRHSAPALTWSRQLAEGAQDWANACTPDPENKDSFAHSNQAVRSTDAYGENLYWGTSADANAAVDLWYSEVNQYNFDNPRFSNNVGHFTQLVWQNSRQLGCGVASCGNLNFWVCRYSPPGNWNVDQPGVLAANVKRARQAKGP